MNMIKTLKITGLAALLGLVLNGAALAVPVLNAPEKVSEGRAFVVELRDTAAFSGHVVWLGKTVPLLAKAEGQGWKAKALLPMPLDAVNAPPEGANWVLAWQAGGAEGKTIIKPVVVPWKRQNINGVEDKYVSPPKTVQDQIARDTKRSRAALAHIRSETEWQLPLLRPVNGTVSSAFGGRRIFNGQPRAPHKGTDLRGATGTPVLAAADGLVRLAELQYFSGNVIYVDHGQGVFTVYAHLSKFAVKEGDTVKAGQKIGEVGATGRVTGPHLHLGMLVQGQAVDAMPCFEKNLAPLGGPSQEVPSRPTSQTAPKPKKK